MKILLAGGAGYIGSHTAAAFIEAGHDVIVMDNFSNSSPEAIRRVSKIYDTDIPLYEGDICDAGAVSAVLSAHQIDGVIHFAGLKAVGESVAQPLKYYRNNIDTTLTLLESMEKYGVKNIVFSSSATVYGEQTQMPLKETLGRGKCTNPYGWTKAMMEQIFEDAAKADENLSVVLLRYFNPVGAHASGQIGEDPKGIPNNLMPYISQTAVGRREKLTINGNDYETPDGTCRRDYIHVMDLARAHVLAMTYALDHTGCELFNIGTGTPYSVKEMAEAFAKVNNVAVPYVYGPRRAGDLADCWANADKAAEILGWRAEFGLEEMCRDTWKWQSQNPNGFND